MSDSAVRRIDHWDACKIHPRFHARCAEREDSFLTAEPMRGGYHQLTPFRRLGVAWLDSVKVLAENVIAA